MNGDNGDRLTSVRNRWTVTSVLVTAAVFLVALLLGFVLLPRLDAGEQVAGIWDSICRAAGLPRRGEPSETVMPNYKTSLVKITSAVPRGRNEDAIGRGATLAQQCAICHGPTGVSRADSPNLAGQYASVIYKQLRDFKDGVRVNAVMTPFAVKLSERDMQDLAAYYSYLPRLPGFHPGGNPAPRIVVSGAPTRGIAPCGSCHGSIENKLGSPWLEGQSELYLKTQLEAFVSGSRQNDISSRMRNVARAMTPEEIDEAARYYANQPPPYLAAE
ncbi:cytochrome-c class 1 protein [Rhizobium etli]|uniref:Cytochrome-c class 1 protein n=1 Tax=Rhizobium etli TaxID=29449 RepID=A0AAN1EJ12_RHIET|nr:c-type cytochrome [Rhizobium etli]ARQ09086.1 cytochrome-c class 1 protein [Rhizobium etli]